jgi:hypothetical protein
MEVFRRRMRFGVLATVSLALLLCGCKADTRRDTVLQSVANLSHTQRATVILRQYWVDGRFDTAPTTYVLLDADQGKAQYENGEDFPESKVVIKPSRCGPLTVAWVDETTLKVTCEQCGLALSAVGGYVSGMGQTRIVYAGFPEVSSWEGAPR